MTSRRFRLQDSRVVAALAALVVTGVAACGGSQIQTSPTLHVDPIAVDEQAVGINWGGNWRTNWGELNLFPEDDVVRGAFRYVGSGGAERVGLLVGKPVGNRFAFKWIEQKGTDKGFGVFVLALDSSKFAGTFGYADSDSDGGEWCGVRVDVASP